MIKGYDLPLGLDAEISQLEELIRKYKTGEVSATELKAHRVPFGVYEQRQADTYMVRIRCAGGFVTPQQLENISVRMIAEGDSWNLPRKFKIAFSGSAADRGYATLADLGFIAKINNGIKGFRVYAAGGLGAKSTEGKLLFDFIEAGEVYPVSEALKNVFFKYGNRRNKHAARLRFLWQNLGEEEFKKKFQQEYDRIKADGFKPLDIIDQGQGLFSCSLPKDRPLDATGFSLWKTRFVKQQKQEGLFSTLIPIELGFIPCAQAAKLGRFLKTFGSDMLRMTRDQNFLVRNIPLDYLGTVYNFFKEAGLELNQPALYGKILSCAGAATCQLGICLSRQAARALIDELKKSGLGFSGKALRNGDRLYPAYNLFAGAIIGDGKTKLAEYAGDIPAKALVLLVKDFLKGYISKAGKFTPLEVPAKGGATIPGDLLLTGFTDFGEYIQGEGKADLKEIILRYSQAPDFDEDKNYWSLVISKK